MSRGQVDIGLRLFLLHDFVSLLLHSITTEFMLIASLVSSSPYFIISQLNYHAHPIGSVFQLRLIELQDSPSIWIGFGESKLLLPIDIKEITISSDSCGNWIPV